MLRGRFGDSNKRPSIQGLLSFDLHPQFNGIVPFVIDTGADRTILMPSEAELIGINPATFRGPTRYVNGLGGTTKCCASDATLVFQDATTTYYHDLEIIIFPRNTASMKLPSLLGKDIWQNWRFTIDFKSLAVEADVLACTWQEPT
jgi:hypothetical protein